MLGPLFWGCWWVLTTRGWAEHSGAAVPDPGSLPVQGAGWRCLSVRLMCAAQHEAPFLRTGSGCRVRTGARACASPVGTDAASPCGSHPSLAERQAAWAGMAPAQGLSAAPQRPWWAWGSTGSDARRRGGCCSVRRASRGARGTVQGWEEAVGASRALLSINQSITGITPGTDTGQGWPRLLAVSLAHTSTSHSWGSSTRSGPVPAHGAAPQGRHSSSEIVVTFY